MSKHRADSTPRFFLDDSEGNRAWCSGDLDECPRCRPDRYAGRHKA